MAKPGLTQVTTAQTFQAWLDKTNDIVDIFKTDAVTASALGDTTTGNATLVGSFTANTVIAFNTLRTDAISPKAGSTSISASAPINITDSTQVLQTLTSTAGPRVNFSSSSNIWQTGFEDTATNNFIIDIGGGAAKLRLTTAGDLSVAGSITSGNGGFVGNLTGNADTVTNGVYTVGNQTIAGVKTFSSNIVGNLTGNASTATTAGAWTTARTLTLGGDLTGNVSIKGDQNVTLTATISGGAASTADSWTTARTLTLGGDLSGSVSIKGDQNVTLTATVAPNSVALGTDTTGNYVAGLTQGNGISIGGTAGEGWSPTVSMSGSYTGTFTASGDITAFSDIRTKKNVLTIENALEKTLALRGVTFSRIDDEEETRKIGLIAQEVELVLPEAVVTNEDGFKTLAYGNIVGLLIEAVKELQAEIKAIKNVS
jgi:hypothetical protein